MNLQANTTLGQYRIVHLLGRGGMGEVYEVEHRVLQRRYALKLLPEDFGSRTEAIRRFEREAAVMGNLEHANIVRVDDFGETDGRYWLRMELVKGVEQKAVSGKQKAESGAPKVASITLGDYATAHGGRIEQGEFANILKQILEALAYAHGKGVVHRDLKPGNILLEQDSAGQLRVKISDFGLARVIGEEFIRSQAQISMSRSLNGAKTTDPEQSIGGAKTLGEDEGTSTRALLGTWEYMSPEQKRGEEADARSDVYAVGLMCFRLLTAKELGVRLPSQLNKTLSRDWDEFVAKALEPEAENRYANAQEMLPAGVAVSLAVEALAKAQRSESLRQQLEVGPQAAARLVAQEAAICQATTEPQQPEAIRKAGFWENTLGMKFVPVEGTRVLFSVWEVRVKDYQAYADESSAVDGSWRNPGFSQQGDHPVVKVSWNDAKAFCQWLTHKERVCGQLSEHQSYRLPMDSEWSVAVGLNEAGDGTPKDKNGKTPGVYPWGAEWPPPKGAGNYATVRGGLLGLKTVYRSGFEHTSPVGSFEANSQNLYDLGGNAWEWCEDEYSSGSGTRVLRGASWVNDDPEHLLSSYRGFSTPSFRLYYFGFRCVLVVGI